ncbi:MAG: hypothetical protein R2695_15730 [Acidimicrobiales bacterium]
MTAQIIDLDARRRTAAERQADYLDDLAAQLTEKAASIRAEVRPSPPVQLTLGSDGS